MMTPSRWCAELTTDRDRNYAFVVEISIDEQSWGRIHHGEDGQLQLTVYADPDQSPPVQWLVGIMSRALDEFGAQAKAPASPPAADDGQGEGLVVDGAAAGVEAEAAEDVGGGRPLGVGAAHDDREGGVDAEVGRRDGEDGDAG